MSSSGILVYPADFRQATLPHRTEPSREHAVQAEAIADVQPRVQDSTDSWGGGVATGVTAIGLAVVCLAVGWFALDYVLDSIMQATMKDFMRIF